MALAPTYKALSFSANDYETLEREISSALSSCVELNMGLRRCAAFEAINKGFFLCEMTTKETKDIISKFKTFVRKRTFVEHATIHLMYIPVILPTTSAIATLKLKYLATGDELYSGTRVDLSKAFVLTFNWPRSLFADDVENHKGLYLGGSVECASSVPRDAKIGMWYPMWSEALSNKQLYQSVVPIRSAEAIQNFTKRMIKSDSELRNLLRSRISMNDAAKTNENAVAGPSTIRLTDGMTAGIDFTQQALKEPIVAENEENEHAMQTTSVLAPQMVPVIQAAGNEPEDENFRAIA